jgi:hypothetical protein
MATAALLLVSFSARPLYQLAKDTRKRALFHPPPFEVVSVATKGTGGADMHAKTTVALIALLAVVAAGTVTPAPARADDTEDIAIIAGAVVAGYVTIIVIATSLIYRPPPAEFMPASPRLGRNQDQPAGGLRFAHDCSQNSGNLTVACW